MRTRSKAFKGAKEEGGRSYRWLFVSLALTVFLWALFGKKGFVEVYQLSSRKAQLEERIQRIEKENQDLKKEIENLQSHDGRIREEIRKTLGYVGEGEILVELKEPTS
jgi:cell division protein FtsB